MLVECRLSYLLPNMETENAQMCNGIVDAAGENVRLVCSAEAVRLPCNGLFVEQTTVNCQTVSNLVHLLP